MQTFLPYPSFADSARALDRQRLGKQRVETLQILAAIENRPDLCNFPKSVPNHPATKMWRGHTVALVVYGIFMCEAWVARGFKDSCYEKILQFVSAGDLLTCKLSTCKYPPWFGDPALHASHRSNLLRKDPTHYGQFGWTEPHDLPYIWPNP